MPDKTTTDELAPLPENENAILTVTIESSWNVCEAAMRSCICGKALPRRAKTGGREREWCSDVWRQRACWARNKEKRALQHTLEEIVHKELEQRWNQIEQEYHRETWQDDLKRRDEEIAGMNKFFLYLSSI